MGSSSKYPKTVINSGLFGKMTTNESGTKFKPSAFQKEMVGITENNAGNFLNNYLNPNYESEDYRRGDEYYTNKLNTQLQNNYLAPMLSKNLLRGSTAGDIMRGFATDLANTEYERQNDYKNQQLQNYMAAMLPYTTIYDMMKGEAGLSNSLSNSIAQYQAANNQSSGLGALLGGAGSLMGGVGTLADGLAGGGAGAVSRSLLRGLA